MKLDDLIRQAHATAEQKGWWDRAPNIPEKLALIHSELSEALEEYRKGGDLAQWSIGQKPEGFVVELADAVIRIADLCGYLGLPLTLAVREKMKYNKTRAYRHGGKRA